MKRFVSEGLARTVPNYSLTSSDGGLTGRKTFEFEGKRANLPLLAQDGEYHLFPMEVRHEGRGARNHDQYFIDVWHVRTSDSGLQGKRSASSRLCRFDQRRPQLKS